MHELVPNPATRGCSALADPLSLSLRLRMLRLQAAIELNQRLDQEVAKTQPRHNAEPLQAPAEVREVFTHTHVSPQFIE